MTGISFLELGSGDAAATRDFFGTLFGWPFTPMDGSAGGGWFQLPSIRAGLHGDDPGWGMVPFFQVPNIEAAIAEVLRLGGEAEDYIADEPGFGRFCNCKDPQGMRFGLHQP